MAPTELPLLLSDVVHLYISVMSNCLQVILCVIVETKILTTNLKELILLEGVKKKMNVLNTV